MTTPPPPAELDYLVRPLGAAATLALIERHGGTRLYVPRAPSAELLACLGAEAAAALCAEWGGNYLKPPLAKGWRALVYRAAGDSYSQIARRLGCTEKAVAEHLRAGRATTTQLALRL